MTLPGIPLASTTSEQYLAKATAVVTTLPAGSSTHRYVEELLCRHAAALLILHGLVVAATLLAASACTMTPSTMTSLHSHGMQQHISTSLD